jgi:hypothetical protein
MLPVSRVGRKAEPVIHTAVISSQPELHGIYVDQTGIIHVESGSTSRSIKSLEGALMPTPCVRATSPAPTTQAER